jgi:general secretion pathway protein J
MSRIIKSTKGVLGFTLIELMVATVLFSIVGMLLAGAINSSIRAKDAVENTSERFQIVRQAVARMAREISMAYLSKHVNFSEPAYYTQFKGKKDAIYFSAFGHAVHQKDAKQSDQQVIAFYLGTDRDGHQSLIRRQHPNLNRDVEQGGRAQVLCPNVKKLEFAYFDSRMEKWDETWLADSGSIVSKNLSLNEKNQEKDKKGEEAQVPNSGSSPKLGRLPSFVRIMLTVDMAEGLEMVWTTETQIPIQDPFDLTLTQ